MKGHALCIVMMATVGGCSTATPLPSWADGPVRTAIVQFVEDVTDPTSPLYVEPSERIATFDNDGTLWAEQPAYFQLMFAIDRVRELAVEHPEWRTTQPFQAAIAGDLKAVAATGERGLLELVMASHAGMTTTEFNDIVRSWLKTARHPRFDCRYTDLVYQPMLELLDYLRAHGFKVYITSGGGIEFMRAWVEAVYGIPPEQVIGSSVKTTYEVRGGHPVIVRQPEMEFVDDKSGKPIAINKFIGRRPLAAFGNSDGDFQMLEWTTAGTGARLGLIVHHTDGLREWAYDRDSHIGRLDQALSAADKHGWVVVDMKGDWNRIFPVEH